MKNGIRPLSIGTRKGKSRVEYIIASEDSLFIPLGFKKIERYRAGEAVFIDKEGNLFSQQCSDMPQKSHVFLNMFISLDLILKLMRYQSIKQE